MKNLILVGGGGHCKSCIDVIEQKNEYKIIGILDIAKKVGEKVLNYDIIGTDEEIEEYAKEGCEFLITVGQIKSAELRIKLFEKIKSYGANLATIISPHAYVSKYSSIGEGTIIMHGVIINSNTTIGKNCIINTKALLEHDVNIGDNCHISTASVLNGGVKIGNSSFVGSNSTLVQYIEIPSKTFIKAGSLVK